MADTLVFDEIWLADYCRRTGKPMPEIAGKNKPVEALESAAPKRSKYGNRKTERHGQLFDSKHEADVYDDLLLMAMGNELCGLARQVPFYLPGGVKYVADFVTMNLCGTYTVIDAKSDATNKDKTYRLKRRLMKECLGIEIQEM